MSAAALLLSILVHAALFGAARLRPASSAQPAAAPPLSEPADLWAGDTPALPAAEQLHEIQVDEPPATPPAAPQQAAVAPPAPPATVATPAPQVAAPAPKTEPRTPEEPAKPKDEPQAQREPEKPPVEDPYGEPARPTPPAPRPSSTSAAARPRAPAAAQPSAAAQAPGGEARPGAEANPGGPQGEFGAAGEGSVRSLGRAFTRAIPPACQADPIWKALPPGSAGTARIVVEIDGEGHVSGWKPEGAAVPPHFEGLARRTLALLRSGTFAVQGSAVTAGAQTLEISVTLSDVGDAPADDLAWKFQDGVGAASFTQPGGRRVEIRVQVVRAVVSGGASPG